MPVYVYITSECLQDMREHQTEETVFNFKARILQEQRTTIFDRYPPPFLKKRFKRQERLIAAEIPIDNTEDLVVVFLRMFVRGGRDYESFRVDPKAYSDIYFTDKISQKTLTEWLDVNRENEKPQEKISPTEEEQAFLWKILSQSNSLSSEEFIFESPEWQKAVESRGLKNRLVNIPSQIIKCTEDTSGECRIFDAGSNIKILYKNFPSYKKLFLAGLFLENPEPQITYLNEKYQFVLNSAQVIEDDIIRASTRSYPGLILLDEDLWISIQENQEANLALSPEESKLLQSVYDMSESVAGRKGFPLFINGRAGSGKSTILQYLFSDYLGFYIQENISTISPPIYLTYSKDLVEKSKTSVTNILINNHKHSVLSTHTFKKEDISKMTSTCFLVFKDLLLGLISTTEDCNYFEEIKYVDFKKFKTLWKQKYQGDPKASESYGPDISWHVIRTYIKGYSTGGYIDEEEYEELPRDEKTVTKETFNLIYQKVWSNWYKHLCALADEENAFWDDQDIVRYIIENEMYKPEYPAIFCDEAQDFTRIELEFLFRSSLFSDRKITSQDLERVPFVFAGDPFQTLNPTGFRWDNIKSAFIQKFIYSLDPKMVYGSPQLHYEELNFNYRSSREIVKLCNSLQTIRALYFNYKNLDPQKTWQLEDNPQVPVYFNSESAEVWERIKEYPDLRIIVPCAEGEEPQFVKNDFYLQQFIQTDETGVPRNVISPLRSKGLEFDRVVVYGFGEYCQDKTFFDSLKSIALSDDNSKKQNLLSYEYYLNQLYVSISRAKKTLIIVDSAIGLKFWEFAVDPDFISRSYSESDIDFHLWEDAIGVLNKGTNDIWSGNIEDRQTTATRLETDGMDKQDAYLLRQAAMVYKDIEQPLKEKQCKAVAFVFEHKYEKAGNMFVECNMPDEAIANFWKAQNYSSIRQIPEKFSQLGIDLRVRASNQESKSQISTATILFKDLIQKHNNKKETLSLIDDKTWPDCISKILSNILENEKNASKEEWSKFRIVTELLNETGFIKKTRSLARLCINAEEYEAAIKILEEIKDTNNIDYQNAKNQIIKSKLDNLDLYELTESEKSIAAKLFMNDSRYIEAAKLFCDTNDTAALTEIANKIYTNDDESKFDKIFRFLLDAHINKRQFWQALSYFDANPGSAIRALPFYSKIQDQKEKWIILLTKEFATSAFLPLSKNFELIRISDFLRTKFSEESFIEWKTKIHPLVVGSAIERAGKDVDGIRFYGFFEDSKEFGGLLAIESKKRLIAIKIKQSKREETEKKNDAADKHKAEAEIKVKEIGIELKDIPNFPTITEYLSYPILSEKRKFTEQEIPFVLSDRSLTNEEKYNQAAFTMFGIDIKISRLNKKIQLTKSDDLSSLTLNLEKNSYTSDDIIVNEEIDTLSFPNWNIKITGRDSFLQTNYIILHFHEYGIEIKLNF